MKKLIFISAIFLSVLIVNSAFAQSAIQTNPICNGMASYLPKPEIPQSVINTDEKGVFGIVNVQLLIDEDGTVEQAHAVTGHPLMRPIAEKAAINAKFRINSHFRLKQFSCILVYNFSVFNPKRSKKEIQRETDSTIILGQLNDKALILQMPKLPNTKPRVDGKIEVKAIINLQSGEVVSAEAISGHPLLKIEAEKAAFQSKFSPALTEFSKVFGQGFLTYGTQDFNGKTIENKNPKGFFIIEKGTVNDRAKYLPKPYYPDIKPTGTVEVKIVIDMNGKVILAKAVSGHLLLRTFAESAARKTKFAPTLLNGGEPLYVKASLIYKFNADHTVETDLSDKDLILGSAINLLKPPLPFCNCKFGTKPQVLVEIEIDESGNVISAKSVSGHPLLRADCETAAKNSKFSQTKLSSVPIKAKAILLYEFNLDDDSKKVEVKSFEAMKPKLKSQSGSSYIK